MRKILLGLLLLCLVFPGIAYAKIGVGVGTGKIEVKDKLKPGMIYELPLINVINTGDETLDYTVSVAYHQDQPQLRPKAEWLSFSPAKFSLKPAEVQVVKPTLNLPVSTPPGDYFAYLEAHPEQKAQVGGTTIGVAAAAKLYFTVAPANLVLGAYYKAASFWKVYSPWPQRALGALVIIILVLVAKKYLHIQVNLKQPPGSNSNG